MNYLQIMYRIVNIFIIPTELISFEQNIDQCASE